ncbi:hypothetical protein B0I35DRAFT_74526 [Stachybotrys elegans]|uniref:Rhodopsin domain-containing protein n=1 Tax=Stachybotrys elegans TaxID=80388 RepID=A0A8K0WP08_9HYPO|nr:hypothetical protein B0I35DRAFT_74526 [Stachybotrys elegans]
MTWVFHASPEVEAQSQYPAIVAICTVLSLISMAIVAARLHLRFKNRGLAADDTMAILSVVFALVYSILCIVQTRYGLGLPIKLRPPQNLATYTRVNYAGRPIYQLGISFFKIALLISYLRLLKGTDQRLYRRVVQLTMALILASHLGCALSLIFACDPVDRSWNPKKAGKCLPPGPSFTAYAIVTIASDIAVAIVPIPVLVKLHVPLSKKVGLLAIFTLGLFTTICSIMRYTQIDRIQYGDGNSTMLILWGTIEFNVGNMVSSLPFLAPVIFRKARTYRSRSKPPSGDDSNDSSNPKSPGYPMNRLSHHASAKCVINSCSAGTRSGSEDDILQKIPAPAKGKIVKSLSYSIQFEDDVAGKAPRLSEIVFDRY